MLTYPIAEDDCGDDDEILTNNEIKQMCIIVKVLNSPTPIQNSDSEDDDRTGFWADYIGI